MWLAREDRHIESIVIHTRRLRKAAREPHLKKAGADLST